MQPSLFTRLAEVESELRAMKDMLSELKVSQDELRQDRDEWRWRRALRLGWASLSELSTIASALRKLRPPNRRTQSLPTWSRFGR